MIEVHKLQKRLGATQALNNLSFSAGNGSITGLLGANSTGKTTCLRIVAGALKPDSGTVRVEGGFGALLDHTGLYARLTVRENLQYFGELQRIPTAELKTRIAAVSPNSICRKLPTNALAAYLSAKTPRSRLAAC